MIVIKTTEEFDLSKFIIRCDECNREFVWFLHIGELPPREIECPLCKVEGEVTNERRIRFP